MTEQKSLASTVIISKSLAKKSCLNEKNLDSNTFHKGCHKPSGNLMRHN